MQWAPRSHREGLNTVAMLWVAFIHSFTHLADFLPECLPAILKQQEVMFEQFWRQEIQSQGVGRVVLLEGSGGMSFPSLPAPGDSGHPLAGAASLQPQAPERVLELQAWALSS